MEQIAIGIPAYRNPEALNWVLQSLLQQSHDNVRIFVFDNCFAESFDEVKNVVREIDDARIRYSANHKNIGFVKNYKKCFEVVSKFRFGMVLSADIGLLPRSLEVLIDQLEASDADVVYPDVLLADDLAEAQRLTSAEPAGLGKNIASTVEHLSPPALIREFFSPLNLGGEYNRFSFLGALAKGHLFRRLSGLRSPYKFHGWEFQNSMFLASQTTSIALFHEQLLISVTGLQKSPQTSRPATDWTRIEPILATYETGHLLAKEGLGSSTELRGAELEKRHLDLLEHYSSRYGHHSFVAWIVKLVVTSGISNSIVLKLLFSHLVRFRSKAFNSQRTTRLNGA